MGLIQFTNQTRADADEVNQNFDFLLKHKVKYYEPSGSSHSSTSWANRLDVDLTGGGDDIQSYMFTWDMMFKANGNSTMAYRFIVTLDDDTEITEDIGGITSAVSTPTYARRFGSFNYTIKIKKIELEISATVGGGGIEVISGSGDRGLANVRPEVVVFGYDGY